MKMIIAAVAVPLLMGGAWLATGYVQAKQKEALLSCHDVPNNMTPAAYEQAMQAKYSFGEVKFKLKPCEGSKVQFVHWVDIKASIKFANQ